MEKMDLTNNDRSVSTIIRDLGFEGDIETLLKLYKKKNVHFMLREEIELALFNSVTACVKKLDLEKLNLLILNPEINDNLRLHAEMGYDKKKFVVKDTNDVLEVPKCLNCKDCKCNTSKEKLKNIRN